MNCFECGNPAVCDHHVVPESRGGTKTVPLCANCHELAHNFEGNMDHSTLTKEGLARAKAAGVLLGSARPGHWDGIEDRRGWSGLSSEAKAAIKQIRFDETYAYVAQYVLELWFCLDIRPAGIADILNQMGLRTRRGKFWCSTAVGRVIEKIQADMTS